MATLVDGFNTDRKYKMAIKKVNDLQVRLTKLRKANQSHIPQENDFDCAYALTVFEIRRILAQLDALLNLMADKAVMYEGCHDNPVYLSCSTARILIEKADNLFHKEEMN